MNCRRRGRLRAALPALADLVHLGAALEGPEVVDLREGVVAHLVGRGGLGLGLGLGLGRPL